MPPRAWYELSPATYLFGYPPTPEEAVRQWVLFEMLSIYGIHIKDIACEVPVRMGSRTYRADIVIRLHHQPHIVIECKSRETEDLTDALMQARSYAQFLAAPFVVGTNGLTWIVERMIDDEWVRVPDIDMRYGQPSGMPLLDVLPFLDDVRPLLYWLYRPVPAQHADAFFQMLQIVVLQHMWFFNKNHFSLKSGFDDMLRVVLAEGRSHTDDDATPYVYKKIRGVYKSIGEYFLHIKRPWDKDRILFPTDRNEYREIIELIKYCVLSDMLYLVNDLDGIAGPDVSLIRLFTLVMQYEQTITTHGHYIDISEGLVDAIRMWIAPVLSQACGMQLPGQFDDLARFYHLTRHEWEE